LAEAAVARLDISEWRKFVVLYQLEGWVDHQHRFFRSIEWGDPDAEENVLSLISHMVETGDDEALLNLFERSSVQRWFKQNDPGLLERWKGEKDPLLEALGHGFAEVEEVNDVVDLEEYTSRLRAALPGDPQLAIGTTKDLLEATMRTILQRRGFKSVETLTFPDLATRCLTELGLAGTTPPATKRERALRKIASSARTMIDTANELRNAAGTGHGKVIGEEEPISADDAGLVASSGLILAAWLIRHSREP
jgi:hypothetical protein